MLHLVSMQAGSRATAARFRGRYGGTAIVAAGRAEVHRGTTALTAPPDPAPAAPSEGMQAFWRSQGCQGRPMDLGGQRQRLPRACRHAALAPGKGQGAVWAVAGLARPHMAGPSTALTAASKAPGPSTPACKRWSALYQRTHP